MKVLGVHLRPPGQLELERLLRRAEQAEVTYDFVGATLAATPPRASQRRQWRAMGSAPGTFERAVEALRTWRPQRGIGASIHPVDAPVATGSTLLVVLHLGPLAIVAPVRVVAVVDEPARFGFAYGTLPGHPAAGEESFLVERSADGGVVATIRVDARPATWPARLAPPVVRRVQRWALRRYLGAIQDHASSMSGG